MLQETNYIYIERERWLKSFAFLRFGFGLLPRSHFGPRAVFCTHVQPQEHYASMGGGASIIDCDRVGVRSRDGWVAWPGPDYPDPDVDMVSSIGDLDEAYADVIEGWAAEGEASVPGPGEGEGSSAGAPMQEDEA